MLEVGWEMKAEIPAWGNMVTSRLTHDQREQVILADLEASLPHFAEEALSWAKVPDGQDPPDFLARGSRGPVGLELIEWLDGNQMGPAKGQRAHEDGVHAAGR